jgi:hypothetical protein
MGVATNKERVHCVSEGLTRGSRKMGGRGYVPAATRKRRASAAKGAATRVANRAAKAKAAAAAARKAKRAGGKAR